MANGLVSDGKYPHWRNSPLGIDLVTSLSTLHGTQQLICVYAQLEVGKENIAPSDSYTHKDHGSLKSNNLSHNVHGLVAIFSYKNNTSHRMLRHLSTSDGGI
jgi:hypothetical protein